MEGIFIALRARGLFRCSLFGPPARRAAGGGGEGLSFGMRFLSACGRGAFLLLFIWAACAAGGRWGPVRGCRPSEAPSALPPDDPAGLSISHQPSKPHLHSLRPILLGFPGPTSRQVPSVLTPNYPTRFSSFRQPARAARLLLRELPSLRSGDLPARRAIPSPAFALHKSCGDVYLFEGLFAVLYSFAVEGFLLLIFACWCLLVQAANAPAAFVRGLLAFEGLLRV